MVTDLAASASNPASGLRCPIAHTLGNRLVTATTPAVLDITAFKAMQRAYQQRSTEKK
jgi:hypothetical protein